MTTTRTLFDTGTDVTTATADTPQPGEFQLAMRQLMQARLRGEIGFEEFAKANLELHFRFGRKGYDRDQYERDIAEHRRRLARKPSESDQRPIRWVTEALAASTEDGEPDGTATTNPQPRPVGA